MKAVNDFRKCFDQLYEDFINVRIGAALEMLWEDGDFKKVEAEFDVLIGRIYSELGFQFGSDCETALSRSLVFQTAAAYKQGFKDAQNIERSQINEHPFFKLTG